MGNLIGNLIRAYRPIKTYNYIINRARLLNSYSAIYNICVIILNYAFFTLTNQMILIHILLFAGVFALSANFIVEITKPMRFIYSIILLGIYLLIALIIVIFLIIRLSNIYNICSLLNNYYEKYPKLNNKSLGTCSQQKNYYFIWLTLYILSFVDGTFCIYFDLLAHNFLKNKKMVRTRKKKKI